MAEKTLNTRILLKNADLSTWNSSTLVLKAGEVALAKIETTQHDAATGNYYKVPTYLMKVGDGEKTFSQLNWLAAPASDVHTWAKKAALDYADLPATLQTEIDNLQAAVGTGGNVDSRITAAINALKDACTVADAAVGGQFVTAVAQDNGKIAVTRRALTASDIPTLAISKIDGLQSALDAKAAKSVVDTLVTTVGDSSKGLVKGLADEVAARDAGDDALQEQIDTITETTVPTLEANIATAQSTADTAKANAATAQSEVDALEGVVATLTQTVATNKSDATTAINAEKKAREDADDALDEKIEQLKNALGNIENVMNFRGAFASTSACTDPVKGDVIVINSGDNSGKEYVYDGTTWVELGNVDAQQTAIAALQQKMTQAETDIDNLESTRATKTELNTAIQGVNDVVATKADASTVSGINTRVGTLETTVGNSSSGLVKDVNALKTTVGGSSSGLVKDVADLKTASASHATSAQLAADKKALQDAIDAEELRADTEEKRLAGLISGNTNAIGTLTTDLNAAEETIAQHTTKISALETASGTHATKADLKAATDAIDAIEANYVKVSGTNLVTQSGDVIIFDCGGATA